MSKNASLPYHMHWLLKPLSGAKRNKVYIRFVVEKGLHTFKRLDACYEDASLYSLDILYLERKILKTIIPLDR
ncbi:hypothetical protein E2320_020868 [Naja naja]|nr:hypothetical protein E2320_020868 [Naja naja]